ncbi:hypothetical protein J4463_01415 [Candidatus Pacearchaeota archaeon]|nr:hypothetical protein [Candidatus Pacearchaeota archaeon]
MGYFFINPASKPYACTADAKFCIDGTYVGRDSNNNCKFYDCPQIIQCDAGNLCDIGECYKFLNEKQLYAYCYQGDPCMKCPSKECDIIKTLPAQIECI